MTSLRQGMSLYPLLVTSPMILHRSKDSRVVVQQVSWKGENISDSSYDLLDSLIHRVGEMNPELGYEINFVEWSRDGNYLATGGSDGHVRVWSKRDNLLLFCKDTRGPISTVRFSPNSKYLLSSSIDGNHLLWEIEKQIVVQKYHFATGNAVRCLSSTYI
jgi:WD40 repeat protein